MLLQIDVSPEEILKNEKGKIIIKLNYFGEFATGGHLCTVEGSILEDFKKGKVRKSKAIFVGQKGGISIG